MTTPRKVRQLTETDVRKIVREEIAVWWRKVGDETAATLAVDKES